MRVLDPEKSSTIQLVIAEGGEGESTVTQGGSIGPSLGAGAFALSILSRLLTVLRLMYSVRLAPCTLIIYRGQIPVTYILESLRTRCPDLSLLQELIRTRVIW